MIIFDELPPVSYSAKLDAKLPRASALLLPAEVTAVRAELPELISQFVGEISLADPTTVGFDAYLPNLQAQFVGNYIATGTLDTTLPEIASSFYNGNRVRMLINEARSRFSTGAPGAIYTDLTFSSLMAGEYAAPLLSESMIVNDHSTSEWAIVMTEIMRMEDRPTILAKLAATLEDSILAREMFTVVFQSVLTDEATFDPGVLSNLRMIYLLAEQLAVSDGTVGFYNALVVVTSALMIGDTITPGFDSALVDEIQINDDLASAVKAIVEAVEEVAFEDALEPNLILYALLSDEVQVEDDQQALLALLVELLDTAQLGVHLTDQDGDSFVGYSVNTRVGAVSEYDNYPFNSFALIGGRPFAAADDGIYELVGDDDDGTPIHASLYTGLTDFGSSILKRLPNAWIGLTSNGEMVLKVVTTDKGFKKENWYRMAARPEGSPVDSRFSPAKGLLGRYWGFKLENIDGADFQLDSLKVWPLLTNRRYSGR